MSAATSAKALIESQQTTIQLCLTENARLRADLAKVHEEIAALKGESKSKSSDKSSDDYIKKLKGNGPLYSFQCEHCGKKSAVRKSEVGEYRTRVTRDYGGGSDGGDPMCSWQCCHCQSVTQKPGRIDNVIGKQLIINPNF